MCSQLIETQFEKLELFAYNFFQITFCECGRILQTKVIQKYLLTSGECFKDHPGT